jgi:hypothetical protein
MVHVGERVFGIAGIFGFTSYGISAVIPFRGFAVCPLQCARDGAVLTMLKLHGMSFRPCDMREKEIVIRASLGATRSP